MLEDAEEMPPPRYSEEDEFDFKSAEESSSNDEEKRLREQALRGKERRRCVNVKVEDEAESSRKRRHSRSRSPENWISEEYMLQDRWYNELTSRFGKPQIEMFASEAQHRLAEWWGPGSRYHENAMKVSWANRPLMFANPPWSMLDEVVRKAIHDKTKMILVLAEWNKRPPVWFSMAMQFVPLKGAYKPQEGRCFC